MSLSRLHSLVFSLLFGFAMALFASCGSTSPSCSAATCLSGCCDASGTCQTNSPFSCGSGGVSCKSCQAGQMCSLGTCRNLETNSGGGMAGGGSSIGGGTGVAGGSMSNGGGTGLGGGTAQTGGGTAQSGGGTAQSGGGSSTCGGGLILCGTLCKDNQSDELNCGQCGTICTAGRVCNRGMCEVLPNDCTLVAQCPPDFACDPLSKKCLPGCQTPLDCPSMSTCAANMCSCAPGNHACGQSCVSNASVRSCGLSCIACPAVANATSTCDGTACGFTCNQGSLLCQNSCALCSTPANASPVCSGAACAFTCNAGYTLTGNACVSQMGWRQITIAGTLPPGRSNHAMAYDSAGARVVLFGGYNGVSRFQDTWSLNGGAWNVLSMATPSIRENHAMVYDSMRNKTVLFGGFDGTFRQDTWELSSNAWTQVAVGATAPSARSGHTMAFDSTRNKVVLFGGQVISGASSTTWEFSGGVWVSVSLSPPNAPSMRFGHAMVFDASRGKIVLFGGYDGTSHFQDTWEYDGVSWNRLSITGTPPSARDGHAMAYDAARQKVVLFGGRVNATRFQDTWELSGNTWTQVATAGTPPAARDGHTMVFDSASGKTVLFGGYNGTTNFQDTWDYAP
jgi:hypothetical protein